MYSLTRYGSMHHWFRRAMRTVEQQPLSVTWRRQAEGLPDHSYTCVLRDAASLDEADQVGIYIGTRNGDVFASADEGDSFQRIATQLPDVLVVRAAQLA